MSYQGPWPPGGGGGAGPGGASEGIYAGGRILFVDPSHPDTQLAGGTDPALPFTLIADALAAAAAVALPTDPRTVLVAPGWYTEDLSIPVNVFLQGMAGESSGDRGDAHPTIIEGTITVDLATITNISDTWAGMADLRVRNPAAQRGLYVTGIGEFRFFASRCDFGSPNGGGPTQAAATVDNSGGATEVEFHDCSIHGDTAADVGLVVADAYVLVRGGTITTDGAGEAIVQDGGVLELRSGVIVGAHIDLNDGFLSCLDETLLGVQVATGVLDVDSTAFALLWSASLSAGATPAITGTGSVLVGLLEAVQTYAGIATTLTRSIDGQALIGALAVGYADMPQEPNVVFQAQSSPGYSTSNTKYVYLRTATVDAGAPAPVSIDLADAGGGWPVVDDTAVLVELSAVAYVRGGATQVFACRREGLFYRNGAGVIAAVASPSSPFTDTNGAGFSGSLVLGVSGNTITVTITGMNATTFDWLIDAVFRTIGAP